MTEEYKEEVYREFLDSFGTHYIKRADMGAIYGQQSMFTQEDWMEMEKIGIDIKLYADYSAMDSVGFNLSLNTNYNQKWNETWRETKKAIMSYSYGAPPPSSGDEDEWHGLVVDVKRAVRFDFLKLIQRLFAEYQNYFVSSVISPHSANNLQENEADNSLYKTYYDFAAFFQ